MMNDLVHPAMYDSFHRIWPVQPRVAKDRYLPPVNRGKLLCTFSAGAYGTAMSSNDSSRPRAIELLIDGDQVKVIRKRETYEDLIAAELV